MSIFFPMEDKHKVDKKHPVHKNTLCGKLHLAPQHTRHCFQWETFGEEKGKCEHGTIFDQNKKIVEKSEKCIWQKSRQETYSHNKQLGKL